MVELTPGGTANINGKQYEGHLYRALFRKIKKNYTLYDVIRDDNGCIVFCEIWKGDKLICLYCAQGKFNTIFLKRFGIDSNIINHKKQPDAFFYFLDTRTAVILELKNQNSEGSVEEKLGLGPYFLEQYKEILAKLNCNIKLVYVLDEWFDKPSFDFTGRFMKKYGIDYHFGIKNLPLEFVGLEETVKTSVEEIEELISEYDSEFNKNQERKRLENEKKKQEAERKKNMYFDDGPTLFDLF